jgi:hypothetical protein
MAVARYWFVITADREVYDVSQKVAVALILFIAYLR